MIVGACLSWGFNQVAIKLAIHDIPPLIQSSARSVIAAILGGGLDAVARHPAVQARRHAVCRDRCRRAFALEFLLIYRGLLWTTATRAVLFLYLAPFFVVIGSRWLIPGRSFQSLTMVRAAAVLRRHRDRFRSADPGRRSAPDVRRCHDGRRRRGVGGDDASHQGERAQPHQRRKDHALSARGLGAAPGRGALAFGEHIDAVPSALALGAFAYQTIWVVSVTFVIWFALIVRYSAARLSVFTFLAPFFGVAAGHLVLGEPLTPAFAAAVALVAAGLLLVNRPR